MMRHIFRTKTGLAMKSLAWATNIKRPLGTISRKLAALQGSTCAASGFTGTRFQTPSRRRSSTAMEPNSSAMPTMCAVSTAG